MQTTMPPKQKSGYLHGMPNATLRHIVQRERAYCDSKEEHWAYEAMVASLYLDLDAGSIASQSAYAVQWRLGWLDGDHDKDRARMRLRRNWWTSVVRAVIYRATSDGRQFDRGPATRIPDDWWSLLDVGDPLRMRYHAHKNGRGQASQDEKRNKPDRDQDTNHDSDSFARKTSELEASDPKDSSDISEEDREDAAQHWSVEMVEDKFRTLTDRDRNRLWRVARGYKPPLARRILKQECDKTAANMKEKDIPLNMVRIDFLVRDFTRTITKIIDDEQRRAEGLGQRPRPEPDTSVLMSYAEMIDHAKQHGNMGDAMQDAYEAVRDGDVVQWRVSSQ